MQKGIMEKGKEEGETNYSFPYMREQDTTNKWTKFKLAIYNSEQRSVLGRTKKSWAQIIFFYLVFYSGLIGLFSICMKVMMSTIDPYEPKWKLDQSLIGSSPGVGFRPLSERTEEGSLIWYDAKNESQIERWSNLLDDFLELYLDNGKLPGHGQNQVQCDYGSPPPAGKVCAVNVTNWDPCTPEKNYSYPQSSPCFFIKLNKIYGWEPEYYDDPTALPPDMPIELKQHIALLPEIKRKQVWISCNGENPIDKELLDAGKIRYLPDQGLAGYYFPYTNTEGYLSPVVAIQIQHPPQNRIINVECRAWAKNIRYTGGQRDREGSVHFELMID